MNIVTKGSITLLPVNDAYTVSLTPSTCVIRANHDGSEPQLSTAQSTITVQRGDIIVPFHIQTINFSSSQVVIAWIEEEQNRATFGLSSIDNASSSGWVEFVIVVDDGYNYATTVRFSFTVARETTMLDWILDWEGSKTKIGDTYIMTPKLFVGNKETVVDSTSEQPTWSKDSLTGIYLGPDLLSSNDSFIGIYGYLQNKEIFHLNTNGGLVGGWAFDDLGLYAVDGALRLSADGTICSRNGSETTPAWLLASDGTATFVSGSIAFNKHSADIFGWTAIGDIVHRDNVMLSSNKEFAGLLLTNGSIVDNPTVDKFVSTIRQSGGIMLCSDRDFSRLEGVDTNGNISFGLYAGGNNTNHVAAWSFDADALWIGSKSNIAKSFTINDDSITMGTNGLRGNTWYIDANGDISLMRDKIKFTASDSSANIVGWSLNSNRLSTNNVALVSDSDATGLYMTASQDLDFNSLSSTSLEDWIDEKGGVYMNINDNGVELGAYSKSGKKLFKLKSDGVNSIAGWNFDNANLYIGVACATDFTANNQSITLSPQGICGYKWKFLADGSGAVAGGNINWTASGDLNVKGNVAVKTLTYNQNSAFDTPNEAGVPIDCALVNIFVDKSYHFILPHLEAGECKVIKYIGRGGNPYTASSVRFTVTNSYNDRICVGMRSGLNEMLRTEIDLASETDGIAGGIGYFEFIGIGSELNGGTTIWHIVPLYTDITTISTDA